MEREGGTGGERGEWEEEGKGLEGWKRWRWNLRREGRKMEEDEGWRGGGGEDGRERGQSMKEIKWRMKRVGRKNWSMGKGEGGREHSTEGHEA